MDLFSICVLLFFKVRERNQSSLIFLKFLYRYPPFPTLCSYLNKFICFFFYIMTSPFFLHHVTHADKTESLHFLTKKLTGIFQSYLPILTSDCVTASYISIVLNRSCCTQTLNSKYTIQQTSASLLEGVQPAFWKTEPFLKEN